MLLGNANVVKAIGNFLFQSIQTRACGHGGGDTGDGFVLKSKFRKAFSEYVLVFGLLAFLWELGLFVKRTEPLLPVL